MLALLIYSYAMGTFSSRQIERSTYEGVLVHYFCAGTHPDHDSICTFRVQNDELLAATERHKHGRRIADLETQAEPAQLPADAPFIEQMRRRLQTSQGHQAYDQRKSTIKPVFSIIKEAMGLRRFSFRVLKKVNLEWQLVSLSYNLKRLFHMGAGLQSA